MTFWGVKKIIFEVKKIFGEVKKLRRMFLLILIFFFGFLL